MKVERLAHLAAPASLVIVALFWDQPLTVFFGLIGVASLMLYNRGSKTDALFFVAAGFAGATAEAIAIYFGAWSYAESQFLGLPLWLPVLWGIAALFTDRLHHDFLELKEWYLSRP